MILKLSGAFGLFVEMLQLRPVDSEQDILKNLKLCLSIFRTPLKNVKILRHDKRSLGKLPRKETNRISRSTL